ncbi:MAG: rhomboid family intramembrane serine protease [Gemmatimonadetes bacterium]|nr:rhomboid family intramembrane serine protease [Gemmatimonadota bacterium]
MRKIGTLPESSATLFRDFLFAEGIRSDVREDSDDAFGIWILAEDDIEKAKAHFASFEESMDDPAVKLKADAAGRQRLREIKEAKESLKRFERQEDNWHERNIAGIGHFTFALIVISAIVAVLTRLGTNIDPVRFLFISERIPPPGTPWWAGLVEVRSGQIWRLITPIFFHGGILHILFNMLWLKDLGSAIERLQGTRVIALLVLGTAAFSNIAQYAVSGPRFGGMSGVVFALLGYVWMKSKFDPWSGYYVAPSTVAFMIGWLVICFTGLVGPIANGAHLAGLAAGCAVGYAGAKFRHGA